MLQRIEIEIQTNIPIIIYSFLSKYFDHDSFNKITKKLESELEQVKVKAEFGNFSSFILFHIQKIINDLSALKY